MHIRRDNDIRPPLLQPLPGAGQHLGDNRQLSVGLGRQFLNQRKQIRRGHQRFSDDRQVSFPAA